LANKYDSMEYDPGEKIANVTGDEPKSALLDRAEKISVHLAIVEMIDNFLASYKIAISDTGKKDELKSLKIEIYNESKVKDRIVIYDNSGGIPKQRAIAFFKRKYSDWQGDEYPVGTWGEGQMLAYAALGTDNITKSHHKDTGLAWTARQPPTWYEPEDTNWDVSVDEDLNPVEPGDTLFMIQKLTPNAKKGLLEADFIQNLTKEIKISLSNQIREINKSLKRSNSVEIFVDGLDITPDLNGVEAGDFSEIAKSLCWLRTSPPRWLTFSIPYHEILEEQKDKKIKIEFEILAGISNNTKQGVMIWGNGRWFKSNYRPDYPEFQKTKDAVTHWVCYLKLKSKSPKTMPWNLPQKTGIQETWLWKSVFDRILKNVLMPYYNLGNRIWGTTYYGSGSSSKIGQLLSHNFLQNASKKENKKYEVDDSTEISKIINHIEELDESQHCYLLHSYFSDKVVTKTNQPDSLKSKKFPPSLKIGGWKDFIEGSTKQDLSAISQTYELKKCLDNSEYTWKTLLFHQHPDAYIEKKKK
jgi:hypothetical protein